MASTRLAARLASGLLRNPSLSPTSNLHHRGLRHRRSICAVPDYPPLFPPLHPSNFSLIPSDLRSLSSRFFSTSRRMPIRSAKVDIGARARQMQSRRLWAYALTFSCIAGFVVIVLSQFEDQLVFYVTPTDAIAKYSENPSKSRLRLGGLVLEGSVAHPSSSPDMEFVVTDLITDILVRYQGSLPDLFREGHSVVVEGFVKPITEDIKKEVSERHVSDKAKGMDCYFSATEVLAKHDEKYMPREVAEALEKNRKKIAEAAAQNAASTDKKVTSS